MGSLRELKMTYFPNEIPPFLAQGLGECQPHRGPTLCGRCWFLGQGFNGSTLQTLVLPWSLTKLVVENLKICDRKNTWKIKFLQPHHLSSHDKYLDPNWDILQASTIVANLCMPEASWTHISAFSLFRHIHSLVVLSSKCKWPYEPKIRNTGQGSPQSRHRKNHNLPTVTSFHLLLDATVLPSHLQLPPFHISRFHGSRAASLLITSFHHLSYMDPGGLWIDVCVTWTWIGSLPQDLQKF